MNFAPPDGADSRPTALAVTRLMPNVGPLNARQSMTTQKVERTRIGWRFWLWWMVASITGGGASVLVWLTVGAVLEAAGVDLDTPRNVVAALFPAALGAAFGTPFGTAQWLVLRRHLSRAGWWILATALGYGIVFWLGFNLFPRGNITELAFTEQILLGGALGALIGVPSGVLQWLLVLRRQLNQSSRWVLASGLSWAIGVATSFALQVRWAALFSCWASSWP
jgi:hypothetical protein